MDSTRTSKASTGVLILREPKDFHCLDVFEHSSSSPNSILLFLIMKLKTIGSLIKINQPGRKVTAAAGT